MLWKRSCCVFYGCGSEVNGYYCWHCVRVSRGKRLIAVTSWVETGVEIVFFFSSTPEWPPTCWLSGKEDVSIRTCVFVWTSACAWVSAHLFVFAHGCMHMLVSVWCVFASSSSCVYKLSHPDQEALHRGDSELEPDKNKSGFLIFPASVLCMFVSIT